MRHLRKYNESIFTTPQEIIEVIKLNLEDNEFFEVEEITDSSHLDFSGISIKIIENFAENDEILKLSLNDNGDLIDWLYRFDVNIYATVINRVEEINRNLLAKISKKYDIEIHDIEVSCTSTMEYHRALGHVRVSFYIPEQTNFKRRVRTRGMSR